MLMQAHDAVAVLAKHAHPCCKVCDLRRVCPAMVATGKNTASPITDYNRVLSRGKHLIRGGDTMKALYVVRSGSAKSYISTPEGVDHIVKFHYPGELVGLDALADNRHRRSVQALETTSFCRVAIGTGDGHWPISFKIECQLLKLASEEIVGERKRSVILAQHDAGERLALFLLQLSQQNAKRGFSKRQFNLSMGRGDVASFLGLTIETVSRQLTHLQSIGLIRVDRRLISLISIDGLRQMVSADNLLLMELQVWPVANAETHVENIGLPGSLMPGSTDLAPSL